MESQSRKVVKLTVLDAEIELLAKEVVDSAFKIHDYFGTGMLESIYEAAFCKELQKRNISFVKQQSVPVMYDNEILGDGFRADITVEGKILLELKAVEKLLPVHRAQTLSYTRLLNYPLGFLVNFNNPLIKNGIVRIINDRFAS